MNFRTDLLKQTEHQNPGLLKKVGDLTAIAEVGFFFVKKKRNNF